LIDEPLRQRYARVVDEQRLEFLDGPGGWLQVLVRRPSRPTESIWIRLKPTADQEWIPTGELFVADLTPQLLRDIPLRRILLAVAASDALRTRLARRLKQRVPADSEALFRAFEGYAIDEPELELRRPAGRYLSKEFYAEVARFYRSAVERGLKPRKAIAEAAGVSNEVAGRWIRQARKQDLLPATEPGKVGV
jgi:hypothetical protein